MVPTDPSDDRSAAERRMAREVHSAVLPPAEPQIGTATRSLSAEQEAGRLIASGAVDAEGVLAGEGRMPGEVVIDTRAGLDAAENEKARIAAAQEGITSVVVAYDGDLTPPTTVAGSLAEVEQRLEHAESDRDERSQDAEDARAALDGDAPVPATRETAASIVRWWWARHLVLPTAIAMALEFVATANTVYVFMRLSDWPTAFVVAASAIVGLTVAPTLAGILAAGARKAGEFTALRIAAIITLLVFWAGSGTTLGIVRVITTQQLRQADSGGSSLDEQATNLGVDVSTTSSAAQGDPVLETIFWGFVLLALGAVLFAKEMFFHEREKAHLAELEARQRLWEALDLCAALVGRRSGILNQVALQKAYLDTVDAVYLTEFDKIRLRAEYEKARYRNELIVVAGEPELATAFEVRFDRATPAKAEEFAPRELPLPSWAEPGVRPSGDLRDTLPGEQAAA